MDIESIKRINREALRAAQAAEGSSYEKVDNQQMMMYAVAVAVAALAYFVMQKYKPEFVMSTVDGVKQFDQMRAAIASVIAGLLVILGHHLLRKD